VREGQRGFYGTIRAPGGVVEGHTKDSSAEVERAGSEEHLQLVRYKEGVKKEGMDEKKKKKKKKKKKTKKEKKNQQKEKKEKKKKKKKKNKKHKRRTKKNPRGRKPKEKKKKHKKKKHKKKNREKEYLNVRKKLNAEDDSNYWGMNEVGAEPR